MGRLQGKVAIITGALGGIGRADAVLFAREGARLVLTDVSDRGGQEFAASLGTEALFLSHDVASEEDWTRVVATAEERFGRLDVLVNNAGLILLGSVDKASYTDWRRVNAVNLDGVFLGCKHALPAIERAGGGAIVNPDGGKTPMVVKVATGQEDASRAEIEAIAQHSTRFCEPEDIANVVLFLASDESRAVNGAEIMVDNAALVMGPAGA